jgi:hypothetical protein
MSLSGTLKSFLEESFPKKPEPPRVRAEARSPIILAPDFRLTAPGARAPESIEEAVKEKGRAPLSVLTFQRGNLQPRGNPGDGQGLMYEESHYDLVELARARDTESLINTSCERHVETALQQGFHWQGSNEEIVNYVKERTLQISVISRITLRKILEQILDQLATYGTAFMVVRRDKERSSGRAIRMFGRDLEPISSWSVPDTSTMKMAENKSGNIIGWKQEIRESGILSGGTSKTKFYFPQDVFLFTRHKQPGRVFGRSMYLASLDDAIMLRSLEDLVYIISQKHAFPIFQYIVGTPERPATDVTLPNGQLISEVELAQAVVENMPVEGGFVTPERHEIKLIGTEGKVLDLTSYIEHFRQRVQDSTRMSNAALGTGKGEQSKSTAQSQIQNLVDSSKYLQDVVIDGMSWFVMMIIAEGGFEINEENEVKLDFSSPDTEENRARENHVTAQLQADLVTFKEARHALGRKEFSEEEKSDTFSEKNHARDLNLARTAAAAKAANSASSSSSSSANSTLSTTRPTNQSGTKATKTKVRKNDYLSEIEKLWTDAKNASLKHEPIKTEKYLGYNRITSEAIDKMGELAKKFLGTGIEEGIAEARIKSKNGYAFVTLNQRKAIFHACRQAFKKHMSDTVGTGFKDGNKVWINAAFTSGKRKLDEIAESQIGFVFRAGLIAALSNTGIDKIKVTDNQTGQSVIIDCLDYSSSIVQLMSEEHTIEVA